MKVYILDLGWLEGDENWMAALSTYATRDQKDVRCPWGKFPVYGVLFDTPQGKILYDTGMHPDEYGKSSRFPYYFREEQLLKNQLRSIGLIPEDIGTVILSHLHDDHCGNLDLFAHAKVYVAKEEYEYVRRERESGRVPKGAYKRIRLTDYNFHLVEEDFHLTEGIEVMNLPGHSHGLLGIKVRLIEDENMFFVMDAANSAVNYGPPIVTAIGLYDNEQYDCSIEKVRWIERMGNIKVIFGHDMEQFRLLKHVPEYYK